MRKRPRQRAQAKNYPARGRVDCTDPLNLVLLTTAEVLNQWRSMYPSRRPGRARSWLVPSWPPSLLLGSYSHKLAFELASDRVLRRHVGERLGIEALSREDVALLVARAQALPPRADVTDEHGADGSGSEQPKGMVTRAMIAAALLATEEMAAAAGAKLLHLCPEIIDPNTLQIDEDGSPTTGFLETSIEPADGSLDDEASSASSGQELIPLRRQIKSSTAELGRVYKELAEVRSLAESLGAEVAKLRSERDAARAAVPSRRQRKRLKNAEQLAVDLNKARKRLREMRDERQLTDCAHEQTVQKLQETLDKAKAERDKAVSQRHRLETRLGNLPGRAYYLQNLLKREIAHLQAGMVGQPPNRSRSRTEREIGQLRELSEHIAEVLPNNENTVREDPDGAGTTTRAEPAASPHAEGLAGPDPAATNRRVAHVGHDHHLRVEVLGGGSEIGGSAVLVAAGDTRILIDAGVRPNADSPRTAGPPLIARALDGRLDAVVVTHGHNDHAGYVPKLLDEQRQAETLCTPATAALLPTMWADARRVMAQQADDAAAYGWLAPLYGEAEIEVAEKRLRPLLYGRERNIRDLTIQLFDAGHILGAAGVVVRAGDERVVVTGDIFNLPQLSVGSAQLPPKLAREADLLVIESTYCHGPHRERTSQIQDFVGAIEQVVNGGGRVLIPAFGLGRAQEVALMMRKFLPDIRVLIDGLAKQVSEIYQREAGLDIFGGRVERVNSGQHRHRLMHSFHSGVVITTSGMLSGGFAVPWAQEILPDPHSALFVCGYQDEESPGRALQRLAQRDDPTAPASLALPTDVGMTTVSVAARVETYSLSAHADRLGLSQIITDLAPWQTMLVHGLGREQKKFREMLERARGHRTVRNDLAWCGKR